MGYIEKMVSVIIPVYQAENYLTYCVESILNQTYENFEILLVDDGSEDGSSKLCDMYSQKYSNVFCIHQKNQGVSKARNQGIDNARGEYILFVDSDDFIETNYLEMALRIFEDYKADMYICGYQSVRNNGKIKEKKYNPSIEERVWKHDEIGNIVMKLFASTTLHAVGTKVYKKNIIDKQGIKFNEKWKYYEDIYFCLRYLAQCNRIYVQNRIMYYYQRDICNSLSKQKNNFMYASVHKTYYLLYKLMGSDKISNRDKKLFYLLYLDQVNLCLNSKAITEKRYTVNFHKLYKILSKDRFYENAVLYAGNLEKVEYFGVKNGLFFFAYLIRQYLLNVC